MKKIISVITAFVLIISLSISVYAAGVEVEIPAVEMVGVYELPISSDTQEVNPRGYTSFPFADLSGQDYKSDYAIHTLDDPGVAKLRVTSCSWLPARYQIVIGLYNISTRKIYGVTYETSPVSNVNITTENCPVGDYYVIVKNNEASNLVISDGIIHYNLY